MHRTNETKEKSCKSFLQVFSPDRKEFLCRSQAVSFKRHLLTNGVRFGFYTTALILLIYKINEILVSLTLHLMEREFFNSNADSEIT